MLGFGAIAQQLLKSSPGRFTSKQKWTLEIKVT
jgi:hypothetical protein